MEINQRRAMEEGLRNLQGRFGYPFRARSYPKSKIIMMKCARGTTSVILNISFDHKSSLATLFVLFILPFKRCVHPVIGNIIIWIVPYRVLGQRFIFMNIQGITKPGYMRSQFLHKNLSKLINRDVRYFVHFFTMNVFDTFKFGFNALTYRQWAVPGRKILPQI